MKTIYIIQEHGWEYNDNWYSRTIEEPFVAYSDRELAEIRCDEISHNYWIGYDPNPFWAARFTPTSLEEPELIKRLAEYWFEPPPVREKQYGWGTLHWESQEWWDALRKHMSQYPSLKIWKLLDRLCHFEVVAIEVGSDDLEAA